MTGLIQSFGIWQRHYGSEAAVNDGVIDRGDMIQRAEISAIGSLANGGIIAAFGLLYFPSLPRFGRYIRVLCIVGTILMAAGYALATASHDVRLLSSTSTSSFADENLALGASTHAGTAGWAWEWHLPQYSVANIARIL